MADKTMKTKPDCTVMSTEAMIEHYQCEDSYYSCPRSGNCTNDNAPDVCNCGAEQANAKLDALRSNTVELRTALQNVIDRGTVLSDWMRNMTGPHDGTVTMLTDWHECTAGIRAALGAK